MLKKIRECFEWFYPNEPFRITVSKFKIFLLLLLILVASLLYYLRLENKNELELLEQKHKEIQSVVQNYLHDMSRVNNDDINLRIYQIQYEGYKKQLKVIEEKINSIKSIWFLD